jgi:hypothetical protein
MDKIGIHKSQLKQMTYSIHDMDRGYITEYDLKFALNMNRDGLYWEHLKQLNLKKYKYIKSANVYIGHLTVLDEKALKVYSGKFFISKISCIINCDAKSLFSLVHSKEHYNTAYGSAATKVHISEADISNVPSSENAVYTRNILNDMKIDVPFTRRRNFCCSHSAIASDKTYIFIGKPTKKENMPLTQEEDKFTTNSITATMFIWTITEVIDDNTCRVSVMNIADPGGRLSNNKSKLTKWGNTRSLLQVSKKIVSGFDKALRWYEDNGRPTLTSGFLGVEDMITKNTDIAKHFTI